MVNLETVNDLAEELADLFNIYGIGPGDEDHPDDCTCRMCFVSAIEYRIRNAVKNDKLLYNR